MTENQIGLYMRNQNGPPTACFVDTVKKVLTVNGSCPAACIVSSIATYWLVINDYTYVAWLTVLSSRKIFHLCPMPDSVGP